MADILPARRGRPRTFDRKKALQQAMHAFWTNGYESTSMAQLVEVMGISSPSIYAAFGSKEGLFREAVELYIASEASEAWWELDQIDNTRQAVQAMLFASINAFFASDAPRGCLVILGAGHLGGPDETIRAILRGQRRHLLERLVARLSRGIESGDLHPEIDPAPLAECVLAFFAGLSIEAVDGAPQEMLRQSAELFCKQLFKPGPNS